MSFDTVTNRNTLNQMKRRWIRCTLLVAAFICLQATQGKDILVFAAASLSDALQEIAANYKSEKGSGVRLSFGASSILARQIQEGARVDLFFSADEEKMNELEKRGLIDIATRTNVLSNTLVLIVASEPAFTFHSLADLKTARRVAIAEPSTVPAGIYARTFLEQRGIWSQIKVLPTENVRAALAAVESGNAEAGFVYETDVVTIQKVRIAHRVPSSAGLRIIYPAAVMREAPQKPQAKAFLDYVSSEYCRTIFARHGFIVLQGGNGQTLAQ